MDFGVAAEESRPLLQEGQGAKAKKKPTPLPKLQIGILMLLHLAEPITAHCIFPFIKQVCPLILPCAVYLGLTTSGITQLISELDITGVDEKKVGYYAGMIVSASSAKGVISKMDMRNFTTGIYLLRHGSHVCVPMVTVIRPHRAQACSPRRRGRIVPLHDLLRFVENFLGSCCEVSVVHCDSNVNSADFL